MATVTSLGFSIFSRYDGTGTTRANMAINQLERNLNNAAKGLNTFTGRFSAIGVAIGNLGPALVPLAGSLVSVTAGIAALGVTGGTALGAFGLAAYGAVKNTMTLSQNIVKLKTDLDNQRAALMNLTPGTQAYENQLRRITEAQQAYNNSLAGVVEPQRRFMAALEAAKTSWATFIASTQGGTLGIASTLLDAVTIALQRFIPVVNAVSPIVQRVADAFKAWVSGSGLTLFINEVMQYGVPALNSLVTAGQNVAIVLGNAFRAALPLISGVVNVIERGSLYLSTWAEGGGFERFFDRIRQNSPAVLDLLSAIWSAIQNLGAVALASSGSALSLATNLARIIAAMPPDSIRAIVSAFTLWQSPLLWMFINVPGIATAFMNLMSALRPSDIFAVAAALGAVRIAFLLMNTALATTPLGWLVLTLTAVALALYYVATRATFLRTEWGLLVIIFGPVGYLLLLAANWKLIWGIIESTALAVWDWLRNTWTSVSNGFVGAWQAVSGALVSAWSATWNFLRSTAQTVWTAIDAGIRVLAPVFTWLWQSIVVPAWQGISAVIQIAWSVISAVFSLMDVGTRGLSTAFTWLWQNAVVPAWNGISAAVQLAWNVISATVFEPLKLGLNAIGAAFTWLWQSSVLPAWGGITGAIQLAWGVLNAIFEPLKVAVNAVGTAFTWLWQNVVVPAWNGISAAAQFAWGVLNAIFEPLKVAVNAVGAVFMWLWQNVVQPAWQAISVIVQIAWSIISAVFSLMDVGIHGLAAVFIWLWQNVVQPAWQGISVIVQIAWSVVSAVFSLIVAGINGLAAVFMWLWHNIVEPVWSGIVAAAQFAWGLLNAVVFEPLKAGLNIVGGVFMWLWHNIVEPVWNGIVAAAQFAWGVLNSVVFEPLKVGLNIVGGVFMWLWHNIVEPVWNGIKDAISGAWHWIDAYVFSPLKDGLGFVQRAFEGARDGISLAWNMIKEIVAAPIRFFVNVVYDDGLKNAWNNTAGLIPGVKKLPPYRVSFASGGMIQGFGGPTEDNIPILASAGEYVLNAAAVRRIGIGPLDRLNGGAGRGSTAGMFLGGLIPNPIDLVKQAVKFVANMGRKLAGEGLKVVLEPFRALVNAFTDQFPDAGGVAEFVKNLFNSGLDSMIDFVLGNVKEPVVGGAAGAGPAGPNTPAGVAQAYAANAMLAFGWNPTDQMSALISLWNGESGWNANAVNPSSGAYGIPQALGHGHPYDLGDYKAQILWGLGYIRDRYGSPRNALNFWLSQSPHWYGVGGLVNSYDAGGYLPSGLSLAWNGTGKPEPVGGGKREPDVAIKFEGCVFSGNQREFEDMVVRAVSEARRKKRL